MASPPADAAATQDTATTLEQFLQTASLGEFKQRLHMLQVFRSGQRPSTTAVMTACHYAEFSVKAWLMVM